MELDALDEIEVLEADETESLNVGYPSNEKVADYLKSSKKDSDTANNVKEISYPYFEIILDEESRMTAVVKDALDRLFKTKIKSVSNGEDIAVKADMEKITHVTVGIRSGDKGGVIGTISVNSIPYLFNLVRHMKTNFYISEGSKFQGSKLLALI